MSEGEIAGEKVLALLPETFMNESGRAVAEAIRFYKIPLDRVFVFHDELDLPPAKIRIKKGGGNAGHNGLRSITAQCGNDYGACASASAIRRQDPRARLCAERLRQVEKPWVDAVFRRMRGSCGPAGRRTARTNSRIAATSSSKPRASARRDGRRARLTPFF